LQTLNGQTAHIKVFAGLGGGLLGFVLYNPIPPPEEISDLFPLFTAGRKAQ
jgi:hypothetical protein